MRQQRFPMTIPFRCAITPIADYRRIQVDIAMADRPIDTDTKRSEIDALIRAVAHDLKGPLNRINGFAELLQRKLSDNLDPQSEEYFDIILRSATRMNRVVDEVAGHVRQIADGGAKQSVQLNDIAKTAVENLENPISTREAEIIVGDLPTIDGFPDALIGIFTAVIENGITHNEAANPKIRITAHQDESFHWVNFTDNGAGVDEKFLNRLGEPTLRLNQSEDGLGLELAVAKILMTRHEGSIEFTSRPDEGLTVTLRFPA